MNPERWQQIDQLLQSALEREPGQRSTFLAQACAGDEPLRREVESLIVSHEKVGNILEKPLSQVAAQLLIKREARLAEGQRIGRYQVVALLGEGGMGAVYLVKDEILGRQVALKVLPSQFTRDADRLRRFEQEARAASALNHPNIITIHEIGQSDGAHFIVTEFIEGQTLRRQMAETRMELCEVLDVTSQVASALAAAHAAGIVHRDIKPENIMVRSDGYVKVLDFGLAKLTERPASTLDTEGATQALVKTDPGMVMGTVAYMSPEQARGGDVDARTDVWSLGVVLYEMLVGQVPFAGETPSHVIVSLLENEAPPLARYAKVIPAELDRIVNKALCKNREERYQTIKDLALDLKSLKQELEVAARLERSLPEKFGALASGGELSDAKPALPEGGAVNTHPTSSVEYVVSEIKRRRRTVILAVATLAFVTIAYFFYVAKGGEAIDSVAVLPLVNVSADPNTEYLSDGISDSIISSLSQLPNLKVIALGSTMRYKGRQMDPQAVGRELNVRAVLTGRLIQRGDDLSISAELVDVRDNRRLWGAQYNRKLADVLAMQEDISREISEKLRLKLSPEETRELAKRYTEKTEAYQAYLQGRYYSQTGTPPAVIKKAVEYFDQAIKIDPSYAPAYVGEARAYYSARENFVQLPDEARQKIESALLKALELDGTMAEAHALLGAIRQDQGDWPAAEKELKRAINLNPNAWLVHWYYARYLTAIGRNDEAVAEAKRWLEADPFSFRAVATVGFMYLYARQYDQAIEFLRKAIEMDPTHAPYHTNLARAFVQKGMYEEAIAEFQKAMAIDSSPPGRFAAFAYTYAVAGKRAEAQKMLDELKERAKHEIVAPVNFAIIYAGLGDKDRAFDWLEKEYKKDRSGPPYIAIDPMLDSLRSDPRFADLARRKGLAP
jgi:serine/threonine protein kinase/Flp pilus assembly protein TadD